MKMSHDDGTLGNRIKQYEDAYRTYLPNRLPIICRLDGKGWHSYTKGLQRPFDDRLISTLNETAIYLCRNIQGVKLAYLQSDEISLLIYNPNFETQGWFDNNVQKMVSISAAMASSHFTSISDRVFGKMKPALFDARVFVVPLDEVVNSFEFRQQDASRNSVQQVARAHFSHKQCDNKNCSELQDLLMQEKQINWNDLPISQKRGRCVIKVKTLKEGINMATGEDFKVERNEWQIDNEIPIFHQDREYIERHLRC
jgi:tRNA(His) guanylyltransferase